MTPSIIKLKFKTLILFVLIFNIKYWYKNFKGRWEGICKNFQDVLPLQGRWGGEDTCWSRDWKLVMPLKEIDVHQYTKKLDVLASKSKMLFMLKEENMRVYEYEEGLKNFKMIWNMWRIHLGILNLSFYSTIRNYFIKIKDIHDT